MAWTQTDLDTIEAAIAKGTLRVQLSDNSLVEYQSVSELLKARDAMKSDLAVQEAGTVGATRCTFATFSKG